MSKLKWFGWFGLTAALSGYTCGCHRSDVAAEASAAPPPVLHGELFRPDDEPHAGPNILNAQAAAGARQDATLHAAHFDGGELNTLGRQKLDLMLAADRPNDPLIVYVDLATAAMRDPARASVRQYLEFRGLGESQVRVLDGINPSSARPTAEALRELSALENNQPPQAAAPQQTQTPGAPGLGQAPVANH